ncbi:transketolase family protein [Candidatus Nomurabacteria bacterium]|nr:transketolase family protein [Candidatus Nomurabacteria bacterium]
MLNDKQKLNPNIFLEDVEQEAIRLGFGEGLLQAGEKDERVVGLCADLTESTKMDKFAKKFPERFIEIGVAEQNLASVASGMAAMGKIPFISSYAMFSPGRNWEQIRTTICYNDVPVKIAGSHAGVSVGPDGGTHQAIEDIAITRVIPNMVVISPCDALEAKKATLACIQTKEPTYIRLAREKTPVMTTEDTPFEIGKASIFYQPEGQSDVGIIATGALLHKALLAAKDLEEKKVKVTVMNLATIKPLDDSAIIELAKSTKAIVTVEEHQIAGGMGSAVAECLAKNYPVPQEFVGVKDLFGQSGTPNELIGHYGMDKSHIIEAVHKVILRKK